jgi:hypothetical protein
MLCGWGGGGFKLVDQGGYAGHIGEAAKSTMLGDVWLNGRL